MHRTLQQIRRVSFFVLVVLFALLLAVFSLGGQRDWLPIGLLAALAMALAVLGLVVVVLTLRLNEGGTKKAFFLLAGASAAGIPICALLHNVVYALCNSWFGEGFWERNGSDEPVFFILAIVVCPALFVIGAIGSTVFLAKDYQGGSQRTENAG